MPRLAPGQRLFVTHVMSTADDVKMAGDAAKVRVWLGVMWLPCTHGGGQNGGKCWWGGYMHTCHAARVLGGRVRHADATALVLAICMYVYISSLMCLPYMCWVDVCDTPTQPLLSLFFRCHC